MTGKANSVWVVAGLESAARWSRALEEAGFNVEELAWSEVGSGDDPSAASRAVAQGGYDLVLFTSPHAPAALDEESGRGRRCACVGERTAAAARRLGFEVLAVGDAGVAALCEQILSRLPEMQRVLFLRGVEARSTGPELLTGAGLEVREVVAYEMRTRPEFEPKLASAPEATVVVLGSPRAAQLMAGRAELFAADVRFVVPGETTAACARRQWPEQVHVAERPDPGRIVQAVQAAFEERRRIAS